MPIGLEMSNLRLAAAGEPPALRPQFSHLFDVRVVKDYDWGRHRHEQYEIIFVNQGTYRCLLNGSALTLRPQQVLVVKPGDWHQDLLTAPLRYTGLWFTVRAGGSLFAQDIPPHAQVTRVDLAAATAIRHLRALGEADTRTGAGLREALCSEFLYRTLACLQSVHLSRALRGADQDTLFASRLRTLFEQQRHGAMTVGYMATALSMTPAAFTHRCRLVLGVAPARALRQHRLDQARMLLEHSGLTIAALAQQLGFADQFHFSRLFKRHHGIPPSSLRRRSQA
jgi:AraC-like DNA-binding protein